MADPQQYVMLGSWMLDSLHARTDNDVAE